MKQFFKTVLAGFLTGIALFILPFFLVRVFVFFLLVGAIFKLMSGGRRGMHYRYAFAHKFRNMSEEDRKTFMQKHGGRCSYYADNENTNNNETTK